MRFRTNREALTPVLNRVGGVVEKRQTLPILGNVLVVAGDGQVTVLATDLEVEVSCGFAAAVQSGGEITLPARKFIDICRALPEDAEISISAEKQRATIVSGRSRFALSTLPAANYPVMEASLGEESLRVAQGTLKRILDKTAFAMAQQDVRYYLNGLYLHFGDMGITAVATDGHRLAKVVEVSELNIDSEKEVILPRKTVLELQRLLSSDKDPIKLDISDKAIRVYAENSILTSKLIEGRYPDIQKVIPLMANKVAVVNRDALRQSLMRTSILSNEKYKGVRLHFEKGLLRLQAHNPEQEEAEEEMEVEYEQDPTAIGFNVGYLLDVLNVVEEETVEISFTDSNSSAVMRNNGREGETYVVMPMRL